MIEDLIKFKIGYEVFSILFGLAFIAIYIIWVFIGAIIKAMKEQEDAD